MLLTSSFSFGRLFDQNFILLDDDNQRWFQRVLATTLLLFLLALAYRLGRQIYLLHFHPLAKFPGPKAAALSQRWLYNLSAAGSPEVEFERLHREYGKSNHLVLKQTKNKK
jgi:hypothetical protein